MKSLFSFLFFSFIVLSAYSQTIVGDWEGKLKVQGTELKVVFHILKTENTYTGTLDSPDQAAYGISVDSIFYDNSDLRLIINKLAAEYNGKYNPDTDNIEGNFTQMGQSFPLDMKRAKEKTEKKEKYQEPEKPYPYISEDVDFKNDKAGITLAGTLTLPKGNGKFPAVVLISGSGPQNRNEELLGHKPFLIIADYLTRNGIAVLRYDDRGTAESEGDFSNATSKDFATDAESAFNYLLSRKEIDNKNIGLIGHSEGGLIAPMIAAENKKVAFIILLAGPGLPGDKILLKQAYLIGKANGVPEKELNMNQKISKKIYDLIKTEEDTTVLKQKLKTIITQARQDMEEEDKMSDKNFEAAVNRQIKTITSPWFKYFLSYNPAPTLEKVSCPVLALFGSKDLQVPPEEDKEALEQALKKGGNTNYKLVIIPNLNHLFQECKTGSPSEYAKIDQTFSPLALKEISDWIKEQISKK